MASDDRKCFIVTWRVEKFSFCRRTLSSPELYLGRMEGTKWRLWLYREPGTICFRLERERDCGPQELELDYELQFLACDGSLLESAVFRKETFYNYSNILSPGLTLLQEEILATKRNDFLPRDALTVRCKMWKSQGSIPEAGQYFARSVIEVNRITLLGVVEDFNSLPNNTKRDVAMVSTSAENPLSMNIWVPKKGKIKVEVSLPDHGTLEFGTCKSFILQASGKSVACGYDEIEFLSSNPVHVWQFTLTVTRKELLDHHGQYLPNATLSLQCELAFSSGIESTKLEKIENELDFFQSADEVISDAKPETHSSGGGQPETPTSLKDDLLSLYNDATLCDVKLRTDTETFSAHRVILCARSTVFKAMFTHDMREKTNDCIDILDLSSDTVRRMLLFLYADILEHLDWESAKSLYFASDKYEIFSLKHRCSSYLQANLQLANCCDVLLLADMHQDGPLKVTVQEYILKHDQQVFVSQEWENLIKANGQLAASTMRLKYAKK